MSYIGKTPAVGNFVKLDAISTSSTNTYNLTVDSVAFVPESANHMLVSLNGVIQAPLSSFSVSGSTITFIPSSGTLSSSDSIDFIMVYGNILDIGIPSDATVTNAKTNFVSTSSNAGLQIKGDGTTDGTLQLNCSQNSHGIKLKSPPHSASASYTLTFPNDDGSSGEALTTNGSGVLTWASAGGTNTPAFHINKTDTNQSVSHNTTTHITFNNEVLDTDNAFTSNTFTVPSGQGGSYFVYANVYVASASDYQYLTIRKNGTSTQLLNDTFYGSSGADRNVLLSGIVSLSATDYIRVYFSQSSGSSVNVESTSDGRVTYFGGFKIIT